MKYLMFILSVAVIAGATSPEPQNCEAIPEVEAREVCLGLNRIRASNNVAAVKPDRHLGRVAAAYAMELHQKGSLTHGKFRDRMRRAGIDLPAAENIARGQKTPDAVLRTWTNSSGHFRNMINPAYKRVGIGYYKGFWVQIFAGN